MAMADFVTKLQEKTAPAAPHMHWLVRAALTGIFLYHGIDKLRGGTPPQEALDMMFLGSSAVFWLVALGETAAGIGILAGGAKFSYADLVTRLSGLVIAIIMIGATFIVHLPEWHFMRDGAEFQVFTAMVGLFFAVRGNA